MVMHNLPGRAKCPECGSENFKSKWSLTIVVAWTMKLLGVAMVKIFEKRYSECGEEFLVFKK